MREQDRKTIALPNGRFSSQGYYRVSAWLSFGHSGKGEVLTLDLKEVIQMGKIEFGTTKYIVHARIEADGVVEKPDVVGAIFGQTEGLLGDELDLRELQKTGRIGRIEVNVDSKSGKSRGHVNMPSSMDKVETAILASALETIDRIGPCEARITVESIEDIRVSKRKRVVERAKNILGALTEEITPDIMEITEEVKDSVRVREITKYGEENLPAGPAINESDAIIVVEGRADVLNLLKNGIKNAIAVEGTSIPRTIIELSKKKTTTVFTDGDRGGELIVKEMLQVAEVDFIARAPEGKEVEELTRKELFKTLRNKIPAEQARSGAALPEESAELPRQQLASLPSAKPSNMQVTVPKNDSIEKFRKFFKDLSGTLKAYLLDQKSEIIKEVAVRDLAVVLKNSRDRVFAVIFDGVVTQRLVDIAGEKKVEYLVGAKVGNIIKKPDELKLLAVHDLEIH